MDNKATNLTNDQAVIKKYDSRYWVHPWQAMESIGTKERSITTAGQGIYLHTETGEKLIDGPGGMWCTQIGYGRQEMADAIAAPGP